jgi:fumarate reductase subunit D
MYCWIPATISKIQTGMTMSSLSGFSILAGTIYVSWSLLYRIEHVLSQSVYHTTSKSCMIQSNSTVYTVFFGLWYKYHDNVLLNSSYN